MQLEGRKEGRDLAFPGIRVGKRRATRIEKSHKWRVNEKKTKRLEEN